MQEHQCEQIVTDAWNDAFGEGVHEVGEAVRKVVASLSVWDREVLGELKQRIKKAKKDLEKCRRGALNQ
jgi:hypothetical protein